MANLPTGTVTLLFTDIESSSSLWDADPDAMARSLALHDEAVADIIARNEGHVVKTIGDAYMAAFARPSDAISTAVQTQRVLSTLDWGSGPVLSIRIGIHSGTAEPREGDYHGPAVNRAARVEAAGHGGQILITAATRELAAPTLTDELDVLDLGRHELRGLARPEQIFQVVGPGLKTEFPPLRTAEAGTARNLPTYLTTFIGRESALADVTNLLTGPARVVTLVGQGGAGKTRLAVEATAAAAASFANGAVYCPLAAVETEDHVVTSILDAAGFAVDTHTSELSPKVQLLDYLSTRSLLVVLDNFEHLLDAAGLVADLVAAGPGVKALVTTREKLRLTGESVYRVGGLDDRGVSASLELFSNRARLIDPSFELEPVRSDVERLCSAVGGIPLGIELAAAWADTLTPSEIVAEIERGLDFLESQEVDRSDSHRSLRAVFEASWQRLSDAEQQALRSLTIFRGGFDREAGVIVADAELRIVSSLVAKSLLNRPEPGRFDLHPVIGQFAAAMLTDDERAELARRHAEHYVHILAAQRAALDGAGQADARERLRADVDNLRAALLWAAELGPADQIVGMLESVFLFFLAHSWHEGIDFFRQLAERTERRMAPGFDAEYVSASVVGTVSYLRAWLGELDDALRTAQESQLVLERYEPGLALMLAWASIGAVHMLRGEHELALPFLARAKEEMDPEDHASLYALLCTSFGWSYFDQGDYERADEIFSEGLRAAERTGAVLARAYSISKLGLTADATGDRTKAIDYHHQGREAFVKLGDPAGEAYTLSRLSWTYWLMGDFEKAREYALDGLAGFEQINHRWGTLATMARLAFAEVGLGELEGAEARFRRLIAKSAQYTMPAMGLYYGWTGLAYVAEARGDHDSAVQAMSWFAADQSTPKPFVDWFMRPALDRMREAMGDEAFEAASAIGAVSEREGIAARLGVT